MDNRQVVVRRSLFGNITLFFICVIFAVAGYYCLQIDKMLLGIACIAFFGGGGIFYFAFLSWKPIAVISSKGITVPQGRKENFVAWGNVTGFKVVEQTVKGGNTQQYIGIFVKDKKGLIGSGGFSQEITKGMLGLNEAPGVLISLTFSSYKIEKVMGILQDFYEEYSRIH